MTTLASFLEGARYDLLDYETGIEFDDKELIVYLNRMISVLDSALAAHDSEFVFGSERMINTVAYRDFLDLTNMNNGYWDNIKGVWINQNMLTKISLDAMASKRRARYAASVVEDGVTVVGSSYVIEAKGTLDFTTAGAANNVIGTIFTCDAATTLGSGDQARVLATGDPQYWTSTGRHVQFEEYSDAIETDMIIYYNLKHRPLLESYSQVITAVVATDMIIPTSAPHSFVSGDGPFQMSNSGGALPTGISASTDYWVIYDPTVGSTSFRVATSKSNALAGFGVDITATGSGTNTLAFTSSTDQMPYDGAFDGALREFLVAHAKAKKEGQIGISESLYSEVFKKRANEEMIRRGFIPKPYYIDF